MQDITHILDPLKLPKPIKAQAWDAYHASTNADDFKVRFDKIAMPKEVKAQLWDLKFHNTSTPQAPLPTTGGRLREQYGPMELAGSNAREAVLGMLESMGINLERPMRTPVDIAQGVGQLGKALVVDPLMGRGANAGVEALGNIATGLTRGPANVGRGVLAGDSGQISEGLGQTLGTLLAFKGGTSTKTVLPAPNVADRLISSLLKVPERELSFGADPARAVLQEGFIAKNLNSLQSQIRTRLGQIDRELFLELAKHHSRRIDVRPLIAEPIDKAIQLAKTDGNVALANRLERLKEGRLRNVLARYKRMDVQPHQAQEIKRSIGDAITWTEEPIEQSLNATKQKVYGRFDEALDQATNGSAKILNERSAGLIGADKTLTRRIEQLRRAPIFSSKNILNLPLMALEKLIPEAAVKTTAARVLRK